MINTAILRDCFTSSSLCRRGCCYTPFGHSAVADERGCFCHHPFAIRPIEEHFETHQAARLLDLRAGAAA